jgi:hypothetical protein
MSDRPTPLTDEASFSTVIQGELVKASFARRLERQRDAYAETLKKFLAISDDYADSGKGFLRFLALADEIDDRHPELANAELRRALALR